MLSRSVINARFSPDPESQPLTQVLVVLIIFVSYAGIAVGTG